MITNPSIDKLLEGIVVGLEREIAPNLTSMRAHATLQMMQATLQQIRQLLPVYHAYLVDEHNDMTATLQRVSDALADVPGEVAEQIRARALELASRGDLPAPPPQAEAAAAHRELSTALEQCLVDLDELQRAGHAEADAAVHEIRAHLGPRFLRAAQSVDLGEGLVGRG